MSTQDSPVCLHACVHWRIYGFCRHAWVGSNSSAPRPVLAMEDRARRVPIADDAAAISERMKQIAKGDPQPSSIGTPSAAPRRNLEEEWLKDVGRRLREILAERPKPIP